MRPSRPVYLFCEDDTERSLWTLRLRIQSRHPYKVQSFASEKAFRKACRGTEGASVVITGRLVWVKSLRTPLERDLGPFCEMFEIWKARKASAHEIHS